MIDFLPSTFSLNLGSISKVPILTGLFRITHVFQAQLRNILKKQKPKEMKLIEKGKGLQPKELVKVT